MTPERYSQISALFGAARRLPAEQRSSYLLDHCDDPLLRTEVAALLQCDLELAPGPGGSSGAVDAAASPARGTAPFPMRFPAPLGRYLVRSVLGEGGMGIVYLAEQEHPRRAVALKLLRPGWTSAAMQRRFEHEAEVLGRLQHPGIAQVFDAGTLDAGSGPQPYFAMEPVEGAPLNRFAAARHLSDRERIELLIDVCDAVQHAHQRGVIHRDLKPANILVDDSGRPKVLDFGVARCIDAQATTLHTQAGQLIGTIRYMSPEQAGGDPDEADTRTDVHALGVILFELLTGELPYRTEDRPLADALRLIREKEPRPLRSVRRGLNADLETIVRKALEKDRRRRFDSVSEFAGDLRRYLRHEPIAARPPSAFYLFSRFARRHRAACIGATATALALIAGLIGFAWKAREAERARDAAEQARRAEQRQLAETTEQRDRAKRASDRAQAVNDFLVEMLDQANPYEQGAGKEARIIDVLNAAAQRAEDGTLKDQPDILADIHLTLGRAYSAIGSLDAAEPHIRRCIEVREAHLGPGADETLDATNELCVLLHRRGKLDDAEALMRDLLVRCREKFGEVHRAVGTQTHNLAVMYEQRGQMAEAEEHYRKALAIHRQCEGGHHEGVANCLSNLGTLLEKRGDVDEAAPLIEESLTLRKELLGPRHPDVADSLNALGNLYYRKGDLAQAEARYRESLTLSREALGDDNPELSTAQVNLAMVLQDKGDLDGAEALFRAALALRQKSQGADHPATANVLRNLASVLQARGRLDESEAMVRAALTVYVKQYGEDHRGTLTCRNSLASLLKAKGDLPGAVAIYRSVLEGFRAQLGPDHPHVATVLSNLAATLTAQGRVEEALDTHREALALRMKRFGADHPDTANSQAMIGECCTRLGRYDEADTALREALRVYETRRGPDVPETRNSLERLIANCDAAGRTEEAAAWRARLEQAAQQPSGQVETGESTSGGPGDR